MTDPNLSVFNSGESAAVESRATRVTFFEDRAEVLRTARVRVPKGRSEPWVRGLSLFVDDSSLRVKVITGGATVLTASVARRSRKERALTDDDLAKLEATRDEARAECQRLLRAIELVNGDADRVRTLASHWLKALGEVPKAMSDAEVSARWKGAYSALVSRHEESASRLAQLRASLSEQKRVDELASRAHREGLIERPTMTAMARVQLECADEGEVELEVVYRVPCALWRPEHSARLERAADGTAKVHWSTAAVLWQRSGERWEDVEARFSTARPARAASPPLAREELLAWRRKTDAERQRVVVDAREQTIAVAGLDRGARSVSEMPGVDDGGEPVTLRALSLVTVPSTGRPLRVEVSRATMDATVDRVLFPERGGAPHLRATLTWSAKLPLLAGPVRVSRASSVVGRGRAAFVAQGEPFELGFGPDDAVRVRRRVDESRETVPVLGTQKVRRVVRVFVSNLSGESRTVRIVERVPVSEIADVEVHLAAHEGWKPKPADGMLERDVTLAAREGKELSFEYELRAGSKVDLPF